MNTGRALIVGIKEVDRNRYGSPYRNGCFAAELDAANIDRVLGIEGFERRVLMTDAATSDAILNELRQLAEATIAGDIFVFYFAGHGGQQWDGNGDEIDGFDETLFAYDRPLADDVLALIWRKFPAGSRVLMISDSCNSGTNYELFSNALAAPACDTCIADSYLCRLLHIEDEKGSGVVSE